MRELPDGKELRTRVLHSIIDLLILQSIKDELMSKNKVVQKMSSRFNIPSAYKPIYPILSSLEKEELILNGPDKVLTLTEKGEQIRQKLIKDYQDVQKIIEVHLQ